MLHKHRLEQLISHPGLIPKPPYTPTETILSNHHSSLSSLLRSTHLLPHVPQSHAPLHRMNLLVIGGGSFFLAAINDMPIGLAKVAVGKWRARDLQKRNQELEEQVVKLGTFSMFFFYEVVHAEY